MDSVTVADISTSIAVVSLLVKRFHAEALACHPHPLPNARRTLQHPRLHLRLHLRLLPFRALPQRLSLRRLYQTSLATETAAATLTANITQVVTFTQRPQPTPTDFPSPSFRQPPRRHTLKSSPAPTTPSPSRPSRRPRQRSRLPPRGDWRTVRPTLTLAVRSFCSTSTEAQIAAGGYVYAMCVVLPVNALQCVG